VRPQTVLLVFLSIVPQQCFGQIIGGRKADAHSRPYMAYLEIKNGRNTTACGGFLIRPDAVLSALKKKAEINENVQCISIAKENERVRVGDLCTVSGWGWTSKAGDMSDVLMEVALKVQYAEICEQLSNNFQCQSMICVGDEEEEKATYKGDSGGPLVCNKKAHGIVSHGYEDCLFPEIFTRISHFEPWIQKQLKRFSRKAIPCFPFSD
uniref:Uncharacterized protein n=1 Tax=Geospiza parvula TaxID=87175 RepID=A0A8U8C1F4_GEOPR